MFLFTTTLINNYTLRCKNTYSASYAIVANKTETDLDQFFSAERSQ